MREDGKTDFELPGIDPPATEARGSPEHCLEWIDFKELLELFLQSKNPRTGETYLHCFRRFFRFLAVSGPEEALSNLLSRGSLEARWIILKYKANLKAGGFAPATVNLHLSAIKSMINFAGQLGKIPWTLKISYEKVRPYRDTRGPGIDRVRSLIDGTGSSLRPMDIRNQAILRLLFDLALRTCEVCRLDVEDVDLESGTVSVLGKRRTQKETLTLPDSTRRILASWLRTRGTVPGPVFIRMDRARNIGLMDRLSTRSVQRVVSKMASKRGISATPRGLRHTAITAALDLTGGDVRGVQRFSRHRDIRVLLRYDDNRTDLGGKIARLVAASV